MWLELWRYEPYIFVHQIILTHSEFLIIQNSAEQDDPLSFNPIYRLQSDVDILSMALTGMKQSGLCVMKDSGFEFLATDTYSIVEDKLRALFPNLFTWMSESEPNNSTTSSWLICMKQAYSRKSLIVYSDDQSLPTGFDIITACHHLSKGKMGVQNRVLYLGIFCLNSLCLNINSFFFHSD